MSITAKQWHIMDFEKAKELLEWKINNAKDGSSKGKGRGRGRGRGRGNPKKSSEKTNPKEISKKVPKRQNAKKTPKKNENERIIGEPMMIGDDDDCMI